MKIRAGDGCDELGHTEMLSTPVFYHANPGDRLTLKNSNFKFNVATYRPEVEPRWIYTYDYAPDQSWTIYNKDLSGESYRQDDYIFESHVYFRVCLRKVNGDLFNENDDLNKILEFKTTPSQKKPKQWIINEVGRVTDKVKNLQEAGDHVFILMTDSHYNVNGTWEDTFNSIKQLCQNLNPDGIIHLGDITDGMVTGDATRYYVKKVLNDLRSCNIPVRLNLGNHDTNYFRNNHEPFSVQQQKELYFDGKDIRYHVDIPGIRMIFLDSYDPTIEHRYGYSQECLKWFNHSMESVPDGSKALIFSHLPPLARLQFWAKIIRGEAEIINIIDSNRHKTLAWINGHNHSDFIDNNERFPIISIANAKCEAFTERKTEGFITPDRELNNTSQEAFDIMLINAEKEQIRFIRFGAGRDKIISKGKAEWA